MQSYDKGFEIISSNSRTRSMAQLGRWSQPKTNEESTLKLLRTVQYAVACTVGYYAYRVCLEEK